MLSIWPSGPHTMRTPGSIRQMCQIVCSNLGRSRYHGFRERLTSLNNRVLICVNYIIRLNHCLLITGSNQRGISNILPSLFVAKAADESVSVIGEGTYRADAEWHSIYAPCRAKSGVLFGLCLSSGHASSGGRIFILR